MVTALKVERMRKGIQQWRLASLIGISQADADYLEFVVNFRKPIFEPEPGCIVGVPSFGVQDGFGL